MVTVDDADLKLKEFHDLPALDGVCVGKPASGLHLLEAQYAKLRNTMFASFRSFEFIPREGVAAVDANDSANDDETESKPWDEMTATERRDWRVAEEEKREQRLRDRLPEDWTVTKTDDLLVLSHASKSYTNRIIKMAEACREYMEDRFGSLSDEYVRRTVIRICKDWD